MTYKNITCVADSSEKAQQAFESLNAKYNFVANTHNADAIIALGGDGFMLHTLHDHFDSNIPIYGMNCGTVGFLMNEYKEDNLIEHLNNAEITPLHPLLMQAQDTDGNQHSALAINEVSLLRQSKQATNLRIKINNKTRIKDLTADGVLVSTPAGSTAYNLSVHGPILPLESEILALTPISPFRPRRWKGALLNKTSTITVEVIDPDKRPASAVADFTEVRNISTVTIKEDPNQTIKLMFDSGHSLEERIISEQFDHT